MQYVSSAELSDLPERLAKKSGANAGLEGGMVMWTGREPAAVPDNMAALSAAFPLHRISPLHGTSMSRLALLAILAIAGSAGAVVIRDDVDDARYRFAASGFAPLADLPTEGHGVLIAPQWVVTAAHAVAWQPQMEVVVLNGTSRKVEKIVFHDGYRKLPEDIVEAATKSGDMSAVMTFVASTDDIALIKLASPVRDVAPATIFAGAAMGRKIEIIGKGATGTGATGHDPGGPNRTVLRHAFSTVSTDEGRWLDYVFRSPPVALPLEGTSGNGDSGGPLTVTVRGQRQVAGLTSWKRVSGNPAEFRPGKYGQVSHGIRLAHYLDWINAAIASDGKTGAHHVH